MNIYSWLHRKDIDSQVYRIGIESSFLSVLSRRIDRHCRDQRTSKNVYRSYARKTNSLLEEHQLYEPVDSHRRNWQSCKGISRRSCQRTSRAVRSKPEQIFCRSLSRRPDWFQVNKMTIISIMNIIHCISHRCFLFICLFFSIVFFTRQKEPKN